MRIYRGKAVALLKALGFENPESWENEKILKRLLQIPQKLTAEEVPVRYRTMYHLIKENPNIQLVFRRSAQPVDAYGNRFNSLAHRTNEALSYEWRDEETIAEMAREDPIRVKRRLQQMKAMGLVQRRVLVQYRLVENPNEILPQEEEKWTSL